MSWRAIQVGIAEALLGQASGRDRSCLFLDSRANSDAACGEYRCADWAAGSTVTTTHDRTAEGGIPACGDVGRSSAAQCPPARAGSSISHLNDSEMADPRTGTLPPSPVAQASSLWTTPPPRPVAQASSLWSTGAMPVRRCSKRLQSGVSDIPSARLSDSTLAQVWNYGGAASRPQGLGQMRSDARWLARRVG